MQNTQFARLCQIICQSAFCSREHCRPKAQTAKQKQGGTARHYRGQTAIAHQQVVVGCQPQLSGDRWHTICMACGITNIGIQMPPSADNITTEMEPKMAACWSVRAT